MKAETYTTQEAVNSLMRLSSPFSSTTNPNIEQVERLIEQKMDLINLETGTSFRLSQAREYRDVRDTYIWQTGMRVFLGNRNIMVPLSGGAGDSLKIFEGSNWSEKVGSSTEGRSNDYWLDEILGILHVKTGFIWPKYLGVDITYRHNSGARTLLNDTVLSGAVGSVTVDDTSRFPYQGSFTISGEQVRYNSKTATTFNLVERESFNSIGDEYTIGEVIYWVPRDIEEACAKLVAIDLFTAQACARGGMTTGEIPSGFMNTEAKIREWKDDVDKIFARHRPIFTALR